MIFARRTSHIARLSLGLSLGLALSAPAFAQDRSTHFDGPYVEGFGGVSTRSNNGASLDFDTNRDGTYGDTVRTAAGANAFSPGFCDGSALTTAPAGGCRGDKDGATYGGRVGYDRRMNNFVVGGLIEASKSDAVDRMTAFSTTPANYVFERELDYSVTARLRAGYTPGGGMLFYVTGGGGMAKLDHRFSSSNTANSFTERRDGKALWGWQAGGGGQIMVTDSLSLGMEYLYSRFQDDKYRVEVGAGTAPATNPFLLASGGTNMRVSDDRFDYHSLRATVGFHF